MSLNNSGLTASYFRLWIPPIFHRQPLLSRLASRFNLAVNIQVALLEGRDHQGCFDVLLHGCPENLAAGLAYLKNLAVEILELKSVGLKTPEIQFLSLPVSHSGCKPGDQMGIVRNQPELCQLQLRCFHLEVIVRGKARQHPLLSSLVANWGLTVTITSAFLVPDIEDGWFDLDLWGNLEQFNASLHYLETLNLEFLQLKTS